MKRFFVETRSLPWSLARGDIKANLDRLIRMDPALLDAVTRQIHSLLNLGYNRSQVERGVKLFLYVHWTTMRCEQGHGSMAVLHRFHPDYGALTLLARALIHQCRGFFAALADAEYEERLVRKRKALERKQPDKVHG